MYRVWPEGTDESKAFKYMGGNAATAAEAFAGQNDLVLFACENEPAFLNVRLHNGPILKIRVHRMESVEYRAISVNSPPKEKQ